MKLNLQIKKVKQLDFFVSAQIALISFICLVNLGQSQLNLPNFNYDDYDHSDVNIHHHHHHNFHDVHHHNTFSLPVNPYRHHHRQRSPPISKKHSWISGTFYSKENFRGLPMSYFFSGTSCVNFPLYQRMASLKPYGCVMLFKHQNCFGPVSMVFQNMPSLHAVGMHDGIASIKNCIPDHYKSNAYNYKPPPPIRFPSYKK